MKPAVTVVIPAFNEERGLGPVLDELREELGKRGIAAELLVVDDGSTDGTAGVARRHGARVLRHRSNRGYGAALKTGILAARNDTIAMTDADGTYAAEDLPKLLDRLDAADMVVGARVGPDARIPFVRRPAKWVLNRLSNFVSGARIPDLNSGLRVFRRPVATQYFRILPDQFSWTTTITLSMHCDKYAVVYVPIQYRARTGRSKIVAWDAGNFALLIVRTAMLFRPLRVFAPVAFACFTYGLVKMGVDLLIRHDRSISNSAILGFTSALLILLIGMLGDAIATRLGRFSPTAAVGVAAEALEDEPEPDSRSGS